MTQTDTIGNVLLYCRDPYITTPPQVILIPNLLLNSYNLHIVIMRDSLQKKIIEKIAKYQILLQDIQDHQQWIVDPIFIFIA